MDPDQRQSRHPNVKLTKCDSISRLAADDRNQPAGSLAQQARLHAMATAATPDRRDRTRHDHDPTSSPGLSNLLAALGLPDPTCSPASSSSSSSSRSSRLHRLLAPRLLPSSPSRRPPPVAAAATAHPLHYLAHAPEKILDAPGTSDDYYTHRLDWSARNLMCVGLGADLYVWHPDTGATTALPPASHSQAQSPISALAFAPAGDCVAVAVDAGSVAYYDVETHTRIRSARPRFSHMDEATGDEDATRALSDLGVSASRITCMSWGGAAGAGMGSPVLITGDAMGRVLLWDMRAPALTRLPTTLRRMRAPRNPVCGLAFNDDGVAFASGGNDGVVSVWDRRRVDKPLVTWHEAHVGAVRALAWCPVRSNVLVTGGGSADARIKYWDTHTRHLIRQAHTGAQVTALHFLSHPYTSPRPHPPPSPLTAPDPLLLAAYGYPSPITSNAARVPARLAAWQADTVVWSHAQAHAGQRVLDLCVCPREEKMATLGADESLHVWRIRSMMDPPLPPKRLRWMNATHEEEEAEAEDGDVNKTDAPQLRRRPMLRRARPADAGDEQEEGKPSVKRLRSFSWAAARKPSGGGFAVRAAELIAEQQGMRPNELLLARGLSKRKVLYYPPDKRPVSVR